jgi:hypothetical protein
MTSPTKKDFPKNSNKNKKTYSPKLNPQEKRILNQEKHQGQITEKAKTK